MKKYIALILAFLLIGTLCACGQTAAGPVVTPTPIIIYGTPTPAPTPVATPRPVVTPAPVVQPTAAPATPQPTIQIITTPVITKDPTGETVTEGGNATFIAKATGYQYMSWRLIGPDGYTSYSMSEAPYYFQGLSVWGDGSQQLVLCNCPLSLNGCSVEATFTGNGIPVTTRRAYISVNKAARAQLWAYPSSGYFEFCDQAIQLNAGAGDQIHWELRYTHDGKVESGTVYSGGCIYIGARTDIRESVYLYAYVIGDPSNAVSCEYTMDSIYIPGDLDGNMTQSMIDAINNGTFDTDTNYLSDLEIPENWTPPQVDIP